MDAGTYIRERQALWARRRGIKLGGPFRNSDDPAKRERGAKVWVYDLDDNLYAPLTTAARAAFEHGDGGELDVGRPGEGNMYALHSSSAAAYNVFGSWEAAPSLAPLLRALKVPSTQAGSLAFEAQYPIDKDLFPRAPNIDVEISFARGRLRAVALECKLSEPYGRRHSGLSELYLTLPHWRKLPALRKIAKSIKRDDNRFRHLHAAQLLKHILGLTTQHSNAFRLVYCWNDVPGAAAVQHAGEIAEFSAAARADGVAFSSLTYQELILQLAKQSDAPEPYVAYLAERYL